MISTVGTDTLGKRKYLPLARVETRIFECPAARTHYTALSTHYDQCCPAARTHYTTLSTLQPMLSSRTHSLYRSQRTLQPMLSSRTHSLYRSQHTLRPTLSSRTHSLYRPQHPQCLAVAEDSLAPELADTRSSNKGALQATLTNQVRNIWPMHCHSSSGSTCLLDTAMWAI